MHPTSLSGADASVLGFSKSRVAVAAEEEVGPTAGVEAAAGTFLGP